MIQRMINEIQSKYECAAVDVDVFADMYINGAKFKFNAYEAKGLGRVTTIDMKRWFGGWDMQCLYITPYEKEAPVYYAIRHYEKGKYIYRVELFDVQKKETDVTELSKVLEKYSSIADEMQREHWYDEIKLPASAVKSVKKKEKEELTPLIQEHFDAYLKLLDGAKAYDSDRMKKKVTAFAEDFCANGSMAILHIFYAVYGARITERLAKEVLFGVE